MNEEKKKFKLSFGWIIVIVVVFAVSSAGIAIFFASRPKGYVNVTYKGKTETTIDKSVEAFVASQDAIEDYLKSPASAKFPYIVSEGVNVTKTGNNKYLVKSYVDSQNSFGAMIRTYYICEITLLNNGSYRVEAIEYYE